jgi:hypothetical protein
MPYQQFEAKAELVREFFLPLLDQAARRDDQDAFGIAT